MLRTRDCWFPVAGMMLVLLATLTGCAGPADGQRSPDAGPETTATNGTLWVLSRVDRSITLIDPGRAEIVRRVRLGFRTDPMDLVYWSGSVWVGNSGGSLQRVDAATGEVLGTVPLDLDLWRVGAADHGIYGYDGERGVVTRHDMTTGELQDRLDTPDRIHAMGVGPAAAVAVVGDRSEVHVFPAGSTISNVVSGEVGGGDMLLAFGSLWVYHPAGNLVRVDPGSGGVQDRFEVPADLYFPGLAAGDGSIWLTSGDAGEVLRVDATSGDVVSRIPVAGAPEHLAVLGGALWVLIPSDDAVVRIDPETGAETARLRVDQPTRVAVVP